MSPPSETDLAALLAAARDGDRAALERVYELLYGELKRIAARERRGFAEVETLSTTALVHEAYLKLAGGRGGWVGVDRVHFLSLAARAMRQLLTDHVRRRRRHKRGAGAPHVALDTLEQGEEAPLEQLLAVETALTKLGRVDPELERLVEWRFFGGLTLEEMAPLAGVSGTTLKRQWRTARAFLLRELGLAPPAAVGP